MTTGKPRLHSPGSRLWCLRALLIACSSAMVPAQSHAAGDVEHGRALAIKHCARCHVIGDYNRMGGIGSTPSFRVLTFLDDYVNRLRTFYRRNPHPVFARVPNVPRRNNAPPNAPVFKITPQQIEDIVAFVRSLEKPAQ